LIYAAIKLIPDMTFQWVIEPLAIFASLGAIVVTGILSGMVPALRAERLEVIEASRQE
jgi:ABC-type antimicrobial peptide transport system permease subunit